MRVLLDTNVLLDVLLKRDPWVIESSAAWQAHDEGQVVGHVMACAITDIFYIARRLAGLETAHTAARICLEAFEICAVDHQALERYARGGISFGAAAHQPQPGLPGRFRGKAREILELLVDKYHFWGARRTKPEICRVRPLSEHGTFTAIAELFQGARNLRKAEWTSYR
jgi:hypothetical protein